MAAGLVTADTSVVIPLVSRWHEAHSLVNAANVEAARLPAHVVMESISALTRLPRGLAVATDMAVELLRSRFPDEPLVLDGGDHLELLSSLVRAGRRGGQVYDALIGFTALRAGAQLLTRDRRAEPTYRSIGVDFRFLD